MIILTSTDKIQIKLAGNVTTNQLECFASYRDTTSTTITPGRNALNTNNTTAVDLVGAPGASTQRVIDYLSVYNTDTVSATVTVQYDVSGTAYILTKAVLQTGEKLEYQEGIGFKSLNLFGALKQGNKLGSYSNLSSLSSTTLTSDVVNNNAVANTIADVTGLNFSVDSGKTYWFRFVIPYTSASSSTGSRWSINGPAFTALYFQTQNNNATTDLFNLNLGLSAYDTPAAASTDSFTTGNLAIIEGIVITSASGTLTARFASEVANSAITAKAGAIVHYKKLD